MKTKNLLLTLCGILAVLVVFTLGIAVGYRRASFSERWNANYPHNFYGSFNTHGVVGAVIDVGSSTLSVQDQDGNEQSVFVATATLIHEMMNTISLTDVRVGDHVTVIGEPNDDGQVEARFIRVFQATSTQ